MSRTPREPLRIAFVPVIRPLFKGDAPRATERALRGLRSLGETLGFEVATPRVDSPATHAATGAPLPAYAVSDADEARRAATQVEALEPDLLLILHATFATGDLLAPLLGAARRVGVWALPEASSGAPPTGPLPLNALCGLAMTMSLLDRPEVARDAPVKWFYGGADEDRFRDRLEVTVAALRGLRAVEGARIARIGGTAPGFYGIDEAPAVAGARVEHLPLASLFERVAAVPEADARALAGRWGELEPSDVPPDGLARAARVELALRALAAEGPYDALAVRCWPELPEESGTMACAAMGNCAAAGVPAACEGDALGALSMLALQGVSGEPAVLLDLSDVAEGDEALLFWHCGNAPAGWAAGGRTRLATHFNRDGVGVVRDMVLAEGPATAFRFVDGGRLAAVASGRFGPAEREGFDGVRGWLGALRWGREPVGAAAFLASLLGHRLPHHLAFGVGDRSEALLELCAWLGTRPLPALQDAPALVLPPDREAPG